MSKDEEFHNRQEKLTRQIFQSEDMLPSRYVYVLTNACNLKCDFCFQDKRPKAKNMKAPDWNALTDQLPEYARVTFTGGEPLLFKQFKDVFEHVAIKHDCNIITNGMLLTEELIDFMLQYEHFKVLAVSIDNINNTVRGLEINEWQHAENMMRYFVKRRNELNHPAIMEAKTVVLDHTADQLLAIHKYCIEDLSCDHHSYQMLKGSHLQHSDIMFPMDDVLKKSTAPVYKNLDIIKDQFEQIKSYNVSHHKKAFLHPIIGNLNDEQPLPDLDYINQVGFKPENFKPCMFPWSSVHINYDGHLFPCMSVSMGNSKHQSLNEIMQSEPYTTFKAHLKEQGLVEGCNRCGWIRPLDHFLKSSPPSPLTDDGIIARTGA